jgi:hypothetical protein
MKIRVHLVRCLSLVAFSGCGGAPEAKAPELVEVDEAPDVPTYCATKAKPCVPPPEFVESLCHARFASVAAYLFQKHTPFVREYVRCKGCEAVSSIGGPVGSRTLGFAEETLLLRVITEMPDQPKQPIRESYDLLRWDGTCVTLSKGDAVSYLPGAAGAAAVRFDDFDTTMRSALLRDRKIEASHSAREKACKSKATSPECGQLDRALADLIVKSIRQGLRLPMPRQRPAMSTAHRQDSAR